MTGESKVKLEGIVKMEVLEESTAVSICESEIEASDSAGVIKETNDVFLDNVS